MNRFKVGDKVYRFRYDMDHDRVIDSGTILSQGNSGWRDDDSIYIRFDNLLDSIGRKVICWERADAFMDESQFLQHKRGLSLESILNV